MKFTSTQLGLTFLGIALLAAPAGFAQQQSSTPDQYQGVSHPPLDDEIVATPNTPAPEHAVKPKPSPAVPMPPPPPSSASETASAPASASTPAPRYSSPSAAPVVTTGPSDTPHRWDNTDYGIVTKALSPGEDNPQTPPYADGHHCPPRPRQSFSGRSLRPFQSIARWRADSYSRRPGALH